MNGEERGQLTLKNVPVGKGEEGIIDYLRRLFKHASRDKLAASVKRLPLVLSGNVPEKIAINIIAIAYHQLGAHVIALVQIVEVVPLLPLSSKQPTIFLSYRGETNSCPEKTTSKLLTIKHFSIGRYYLVFNC